MEPVRRLSRQERVLAQVQAQPAPGLEQGSLAGVDAAAVAAALSLDRANVSKELNLLYRSGQLIKCQGKPTRFLHRVLLSQVYPGRFLPTTVPRGEELRDILARPVPAPSSPSPAASELETSIGAGGSLHTAVALAKGAVSYPPKGLHTLITGSIGVGKVRFARMMYDHAVRCGKLPSDAPFLVFHCQDYADSPQLLLSQLFGRGKGAVPGSEKGRRGLIEQAAGGILCLNNVQRLPHRVQDLLVTLIEKNTFNRVGEAAVTRYSETMLIAVSSEPPGSEGLDRFVRSIPVLITLPDLDERGPEELLEHLFLFFGREAAALGIPFRIPKDVLACLVQAPYPGQIGEMKSRVKIICSSAYLEYSSSPPSGVMEIGYRHLPPAVMAHPPAGGTGSARIRRLFARFTLESVLFTPGAPPALPLAPEDPPAPDSGEDPEPLAGAWGKEEIETYISRCAARFQAQSSILPSLSRSRVPPALYEAVQRVLLSHPEYRAVTQNSGLFYGFLLHLSGAVRRQLQGLPPAAAGGSAPYTNPAEYAVARELQEALSQAMHVTLPDCELDFIAVYLYLAIRWSGAGRVGLLAVFHGQGVARSLAAYINAAYNADLVRGICYDSQSTMESLLEEVVRAAQEEDQGSGILIFADMEPLTQLHRHITAVTHLPAETVGGACLPLMLELTGQAARGGCSLPSLAEAGRTARLPPPGESGHEVGSAFLSRIINEVLSASLTFLNPRKGAETLLSALDGILHDLGLPYSDEIAVKFLFHCAHMLERVIRGDVLKYARLKPFVNENAALILLLERRFNRVGEIFGVSIPVCELAYTAEIFLPLIHTDRPPAQAP